MDPSTINNKRGGWWQRQGLGSAAKEAWMEALPAHDPLTCPCCQEGRQT